MRVIRSFSASLLLFMVLRIPQACADWGMPASRFITETTGAFEVWVDSRDLLVMHHPWVVSTTGGFASARVSIDLSTGEQKPERLAFYCSDDYFNDFWRAKNESWLGGDGFFGHRFKQVWAGEELLWESDVADANPPSLSGQYVFDLPASAVAQRNLDLELRVIDRVASTVELASDTQHICDCETAAEKPGDPPSYMTHVYWGDFVLLSQGENPPELKTPLQDRVETIHGKRWPVEPYGDPSLSLPFEFRLASSAPLPSVGFPVKCGIPFPAGLVPDEVELRPSGEGGFSPGKIALFRVQDEKEEGIPATFEPTSLWPDGSVKWASVTFQAHSGDERIPFKLHRTPDRVGSEISSAVLPPLQWRPSANGDPIQVHGEEVLSATSATPSIQARLETRAIPLGTKEAIPAAEYDLTLFFSTPTEPPLERISLATEIPLESLRSVVTGLGVEPIGRAIQSASSDLVSSSPTCWVAIQDSTQTHFFAYRNASMTGQTGFRLNTADDRWRVELEVYRAVAPATGYPFTPGEAKTFQVLYAVLPSGATVAEFERLASNFDRPPLLLNRELLSRSGVMGYSAAPDPGNPGWELVTFLRDLHPDPLGATFQWGTSPRDFGDIIYSGENSWRNGYYDVREGFVAAYLLSGSREWADALDRTVQHTLDVDMIHSSMEHPEWVGLPHGYGINHTSMEPWNPILRMNGILDAAHIWANGRYLDAAKTMAERIAETGRAVGAVSVRDHAGVMMSLAVAYAEWRDPVIKEAADRLVEDIWNHRIDPRRGTYPEVHGNHNYRGNVPWMTAQLIEPLYLYYRESGNLKAAQMVVGLAISILCENQTRGVPGDISGYSHNPHFAKTSGYHVSIAPALFYAYELSGDEAIRAAAVAAWEQTVRENTINSVLNCFWNAPTLAHYLQETSGNREK